jgi:glycosyltransferase involved in cell wall biosynthesis
MHIISLSLDPQLLDASSVPYSRARWYSTLVATYDVLVPHTAPVSLALSPQSTIQGTGGTFKWLQYLRLWQLLRRHLTHQHYDVVTTQDAYFMGLLGVWAQWIYRVGLEVQAHGIEKDWFFRRTLAGFVYRRARVIRVVSTSLQLELQKRYGLHPDMFVCVPIFVDTSSLQLETQRSHLSMPTTEDETVHILSVGRLVSTKNVHLQLVLTAQLLAQGENVHLHIVGDGPQRGLLEREAADLGIDGHVTFLGTRTGKALGESYTSADVFLHTAHSEGYGMVFVEALRAGLPIVSTDVGCIRELTENTGAASLAAVGDSASLGRILIEVVSSSALRKKMRQATDSACDRIPTQAVIASRYLAAWNRAGD